ncbi:MAG: hypothetical protein Q9169_000371 [Polycauliona sp. 2 TL-2023]
MPGFGDQHRATSATVNPYEEVKPHVSEYTAQEIATLSSRLEKQLGPEYISTRPGASGTRVPYLAADKAINLANEVFGFNGWSSCIKDISLDFVDEPPGTGKVSLGLSVIVRVTLRDGTYHEDIGYGHIENCKGKAAAFEKAKKEGTTDAMKRALRNFGNILGNCVYDKDFVAKVSKLKVAPSRWDPDNLHRHADYAPVKKEPAAHQKENIVQVKSEKAAENGPIEPEDEFATDDFDEVDFSVGHEIDPADESLAKFAPADSRASIPYGATAAGSRIANGMILAPISTTLPMLNYRLICECFVGRGHPPGSERDAHVHPVKGNGRTVPKQQDQGVHGPATLQRVNHQDYKPQNHSALPPPNHNIPQDAQVKAQKRPPPAEQNDSLAPSYGPSFGTPPPTTSVSGDPPVGFFTARAAEAIQSASSTIPPQAPSFNPHLESPSIRKTAGVDHTKTKPVARELVGAPAPPPVAVNPAAGGRPNFVNPQADKTRRVGMPGGAASPLANRSSYKPPQMKRPAEGNAIQQSRPALGDVTGTTVNVAPGVGAGGDVKRQKTHDPQLPAPG